MENEKRLIDANALIAEFDERNSDTFFQYHTRANKEYWWGMNTGVNWGVNTINNATTVDAVEVVRCKDCKHGIWDEEEQMWECVLPVDLTGDRDTYSMFREYNEGEHFCANGERKEK